MPVLKLSQHFVDNELRCPHGKNKIEFCDTDVPGLYALVSAASPGRGTYLLRYKNANGTTCHQKSGRTTDVDLAEARKRARTLRAQIALGADPRGEAKAQKEVPTLDDFVTTYYMPHVKAHKRSWASDLHLYNKGLRGAFGSKQLSQIGRHQIQAFHVQLRESGLAPATCDHYVKFLRHALNLAIDWDLLQGSNPAARVPLFNADNRRETYLDEDQLKRLVTVLRTDSNRAVCNIALFLLATGARFSEAATATWDQVDTEGRAWRIPARTSKSKKVRDVPLNDVALEILSKLESKGGNYIFANEETGKPYTTIAKAWERLRNAAGLPSLRLHDLRHSYASILVQSGRTLYEVQQILGHSDAKVTSRYAHLDRRTLQEASNAASLAINGATKRTA